MTLALGATPDVPTIAIAANYARRQGFGAYWAALQG